MSKVFIEETSLSAIGDAIRKKTGKSDLLSPAQMVTAIGSITGGGSGGDIEPIVLSTDCSYACSGAVASATLVNFPDKISTQNITNASNMFFRSTVENIPFDINMVNSSYSPMQKMFQECKQLKQLPVINNGYPSDMTNIFGSCSSLAAIPDDYANWNFNRVHTYSYCNCGSMFISCERLRYIPEGFLNQLWGIQTSGTYSIYYYTFSGCYSLDEVKGLGVNQGALTSNHFVSTFSSCNRLKGFTFSTDDNGNPLTANWRNQLIDLSSVGYEYITYSWYEPNRYYDIGKEKWIYDEATYQALKNDPDSFVGSYDNSKIYHYSRYNKASALETIESLPDCSASGGTNTIKFRGEGGMATDEGAINTLTEEEIAVATAKGWTVTFV